MFYAEPSFDIGYVSKMDSASFECSTKKDSSKQRDCLPERVPIVL